MIKIAHRGNINGKLPEMENSPNYVMAAIEKGYDCEIDLWCLEKKVFSRPRWSSVQHRREISL